MAIRIAHAKPGLRLALLRAIKAADGRVAKPWGKLPKGWTEESVKKFWSTMTGDVKHKVTKCMKEMEGKVDDTGAFCGSLADKVEGTTSWRGKEAAASTKHAMIFFADGRSKPVSPANGSDFKLRELQKVVGGLIEVVYLPNNKIMVANEEGLLMRLPPNRSATRLAGHPIVGDVVVMDSDMLR